MAKLGGTKFTWVIKNFSSMKSRTRDSDIYDIGTTGYDCYLEAYRSTATKLEGLCIRIIYGSSLPTERRRCFKYRLTSVNQFSEELSIFGEGIQWFNPLNLDMAYTSVFLAQKFLGKDSGFLVNNQVKIVVEVDVLEDVPVETEITTKPETNIEKNNSAVSSVLLLEGSSTMESVDVNGFLVFPSQVGSVTRIFEKHPDIAVDFRAKNQHVRSACMSSLLGLIETLCKSLHELSIEDLIGATIALKHVKDAGFKVDWLEKNLEQVRAKKLKELSYLAMLKETEEKALKLKRKFKELDSLAEGQKKKLSATRTPLSFDDVV
ncbi:unnamed protein product [Eruca vesicaria subsp. sativa]|uniref:MATH domain-containing protein n=1 Tax=Eruca vesicaria subsp. sativa TaxID=29727 RepID=A0ABC8L5E2_ERUVS|nr:unnamed protein product [Eruca vesicaria subsp. sativa]